jgi:hypothetical protein
LPTSDEVTQMMMNAFSSQSSQVQSNDAWAANNASTEGESVIFREMTGSTHENSSYSYSQGMFMNSNSQSPNMSGVADGKGSANLYIYSNYSTVYSYNHADITWGVYLVSDGGTTLDSQLDPTINANNVNYVAPEPAPSPEASDGSGLNLASDLAPSGTDNNEIRFAY